MYFEKISEKIFYTKIFFGAQNICLVHISLIFSTRKELDSDLNAGRLGVHGQLYGKISEEARKGPE